MAIFFRTNKDVLFFVYGLVFFTLGLVIVLQTRRSSRLDLARSLVWLAAFGLTHSLNEWGDVIIPLQANYLSQLWLDALYLVQLILLAVSFACIFEFGLTLLYPLGPIRWMHALPAGLMLVWAIASFLFIHPFSPDLVTWRHVSNSFARYFIGLPGALFAAYGLRQHTLQRIAPLNVPSIVTNLRIAGIAIAVYGILAGAVPLPVPFFPGNLVNTDTFFQFVGVPVLAFRSLIGLIITVTIINGLEIFDLETQRRIETLEQQQIVAAERQRIARDLHDGAIQKVYTAGLLVESAAKLLQPDGEVSDRVSKAAVILNDAITDLRSNLTELHSAEPVVYAPLVTLLPAIVNDPRYASMVHISLEMDLPPHAKLSPLRTDHLLAIVNEAFANIVRHARARNVSLHVRDAGEMLRIVIEDDGIGIPADQTGSYGLRNMRDRAHLLDGRIDFASPQGKGTTVTLEIPWVD